MQQITKTNPIRSDFSIAIQDIIRVPEFINFTIWFATPKQFRVPKTQKDFSKEIGVCQDTLTDWKNNPHFWPLMQQAMSHWIKERVPDVVGGLYKKAVCKGNAKDVEMFVRLAGIDINKNDTK